MPSSPRHPSPEHCHIHAHTCAGLHMDDTSLGSSIHARRDEARGRGWHPERCDRIALVLQGGGALGAYQAGVYQAMHEAGIEPDWVSGVSIGAINAAIIA